MKTVELHIVLDIDNEDVDLDQQVEDIEGELAGLLDNYSTSYTIDVTNED